MHRVILQVAEGAADALRQQAASSVVANSLLAVLKSEQLLPKPLYPSAKGTDERAQFFVELDTSTFDEAVRVADLLRAHPDVVTAYAKSVGEAPAG